MTDPCCCNYGAAVSGELPEFICFYCPKSEHSLSGMAERDETCKRHERQSIAEKIQQRRRQIIVHSIIYYEFGDNILSDYDYDKFGRELIQLQTDHPDIAGEVEYHREAFETYTSPTGFDLPMDDPKDRAIAQWLIDTRDKDITDEQAE